MKKIFTLFVSLLLVVFASAQITVSDSEVFVPGNVFHLGIDTLLDASITPGASGSADWDFSALNANDTTVLEIIDAAGTPYAANYPSANIVVLSDSVYVYYKKTVDKLEIVGTAFSENLDSSVFEFIFIYRNPETVVEFPVNFGNAFTDMSNSYFTTSGEFFGADSIRIKNGVTRNVEIDGFGNITTPTGTFEALRVREERISFDSIDFQTFGFWVPFDADEVGDTSVHYLWVTNQTGFEYPLVTMDTERDSISGAEIAVGAGWMAGSLVSAPSINPVLMADVFPIPTASDLNFQFQETIKGSLVVIDFNGQKLFSQKVDSDFVKIDLNDSPTGSYVAVFSDEFGKLIGFRKFSVVR